MKRIAASCPAVAGFTLRHAGVAALLAVLLPYLATVAMRAHFTSPKPTPIVYDRQGVFLAQFGDVIPSCGTIDPRVMAGLGPATYDFHCHKQQSRRWPASAGHDTGGSVSARVGITPGEGAPRVTYGYWPVAPLPQRVVAATLALEDRRFWSHPGVDPVAVLRAAWQDMVRLRRRTGASTIAMQVARMQHPEARTFWHKAVEAGTALALTLRYGRDAVLAQYLRLVPYGNGSHGIGHAARWYFDKPAADLSWAEIALMCAIPRAPAAYNPLRPDGLRRARDRAGRILAVLHRQAVISDAEYSAAVAQLAAISPGPAPHRPVEALHPILRLRDMLAATPPPASPSDDRVFASLDLGLQRSVAQMMHEKLVGWRAAGAQQAAVMVVQRGDDAVLASVGSDGYTEAHGGAIDFTRAIRSPGSTLKPFLYAAALQQGLLHPADMLDDSPGQVGAIHNADARFLGPLPPGQALANSRNVPAAEVLRRLGLGVGFDLFHALGLQALADTPDSLGLAMAIGAMPTSLDRLADAYSALADDGIQRGLLWYRGEQRPAARRVFTTAAAREVGLFLSDPLARLPSFGRYGSTEYPFPVAVKTGTSQGFRDAWTVAWSDRFVVAAWVGRADGGTMAELGGANSAADLVHAVLMALHHALPGDLSDTSFEVPQGYAPVSVCAGPDETPRDDCSHSLLVWLPHGTDIAKPKPTGPDPAAAPVVRLSVLTPEAGTRVWLNPESPPAANRLVLRAETTPHVPQIVWYVDGAPFAVTDPDRPVTWPMQTGEHRFQIGLPLRPERSRSVKLLVR